LGKIMYLLGVGHCFAWQGTRPLVADEPYVIAQQSRVENTITQFYLVVIVVILHLRQ
jgi:hypothetical protein